MSYIYDINSGLSLIDSDDNALLDISDFNGLQNYNHSQQFIPLMGRSGKRKQSFNTSEDQSETTNTTTDIDDDSGFCGSNPSSNVHKMVRFDEEFYLLKTIMKEVNTSDHSMVSHNNQLNHKINSIKPQNYSSKSKNGKYELKILSQPEEQHRARYLTEGSRGAIKDKSGLSHPIVKLCGYDKSYAKIECFIGHDKQLGAPHLFYQASKITGKNSTRCTAKRVDGTTLIVMDACPDNDMQVTVDCVGILKERNVDVEQKLLGFKAREKTDSCDTIPTKKRSTRCRMVFRARIPETNEVLQAISSPILCTQPLGTPEICKKSVSQSDAKGGQELFIIGKNFLKDSKVIFKTNDWTKVVEPDKEFLHSTHLVCVIPCYDGQDLKCNNSIDVHLSIKSGGKYSEAHTFTYINSEKVNTMTFLNGTAQMAGMTTTDQLLVSNFNTKPIILTMIGSTAVADNGNTLTATIGSNATNPFGNGDKTETILSTITEDSLMSCNATSLQTIEDIQMTSSSENILSYNKTPEVNQIPNDMNVDQKSFKTESYGQSVLLSDLVSQYLPINRINTTTHSMINNSTISCDTISNILDPMSSTPMTASAINTEPNLLMSEPMVTIESKPHINAETIAMKTITAQNPVLTSTAGTTPVTQANNISALTEMSDAELLRFINPSTFDQI